MGFLPRFLPTKPAISSHSLKTSLIQQDSVVLSAVVTRIMMVWFVVLSPG